MRASSAAAFALLALLAGCDRGATGEERLRAMVDSIMPRLTEIADLEARERVNVERRSAAQVRAYVERKMTEDFPPGELEGIQAAYALLGLLPDTLDLRGLLGDLYQEQIVGYYDPDSTTLYVVEGVPAAALRPVLAHELVHALQDQHVDLAALIARERGNDRQLAAQAAIEGHATLVMFAWMASEQSGATVPVGALPDPSAQVRSGLEAGDGFPVFQAAPPLLREVLVFPYVAGSAFVHAAWASRPDEERPSFAGLIPESTEQIMRPIEKYLEAVDSPTDLRFGAGPGVRLLHENTLGAFETSVFLKIHGQPEDAALGWDGDRYRVLEHDGGTRVLEWYSVWDDSASAAAFATAARRALNASPTGYSAEVSERSDGRPWVALRIATDASALSPPSAALVCSEDGQTCTVTTAESR